MKLCVSDRLLTCPTALDHSYRGHSCPNHVCCRVVCCLVRLGLFYVERRHTRVSGPNDDSMLTLPWARAFVLSRVYDFPLEYVLTFR